MWHAVDPHGGKLRIVSETWDGIAEWWIDVVDTDPGQSTETHDLLNELVRGTSGVTLDLGCGEGQGLRSMSSATGVVLGVDLSMHLLRRASRSGPVVQARLPDLSWVRANVVDRAVSVGLLDLIPDHALFFAETARVVRPGGHLVVVINHPVATSPESEPMVAPDGEILWRWGTYLTSGSLPQDVEGQVVELFHRPLGVLVTDAAAAGWILEALIERGPSGSTIESSGDIHGHEELPTMAGFRWRLSDLEPGLAAHA